MAPRIRSFSNASFNPVHLYTTEGKSWEIALRETKLMDEYITRDFYTKITVPGENQTRRYRFKYSNDDYLIHVNSTLGETYDAAEDSELYIKWYALGPYIDISIFVSEISFSSQGLLGVKQHDEEINYYVSVKAKPNGRAGVTLVGQFKPVLNDEDEVEEENSTKRLQQLEASAKMKDPQHADDDDTTESTSKTD